MYPPAVGANHHSGQARPAKSLAPLPWTSFACWVRKAWIPGDRPYGVSTNEFSRLKGVA